VHIHSLPIFAYVSNYTYICIYTHVCKSGIMNVA